MQEERTLVSFDWAIKYLLRNKADYVILEGFLTTLLGKKINIQSLVESESNKVSEGDKYNRTDVLAEEEDGTLTIIELQFTPEIDYFHRMLFGSSKAIVEHIGEGTDYSEVKKVYSVNVVYFDLGSGRDYIYHGTTTFKGLHYNDELELSSAQKAEFAKLEVKDIFPEFYILKVDRFKDIVQNKIDEWVYFLKHSKVRSEFNAPGLEEAVKKLEYSRLSPEERRAYDKYVDIRRSNRSTIYTAKLEGKAIGIEKGEVIGEARGIKKTAKNMKFKGFDVAVISEVTGLSVEEIEKL
ncbi:MAG: Rpn family recombination-promoting nuclease/putative transposase [Candidatus Fibromonas sp.]|jgi:predicted transposase/invertase (TIGR01784 family)|nr:Rpn family recombination-promoting nuclease/putative transposase [Candidatus Fibromonas sp.]